ncbi:aminoacyl-tRNA hydrolase [Lampropedia aestuarii]|uniref:Peptidyl-tRNA hydrolase n=1 Tax=Lampropedia aestuarii TaxID=2562762 RepID=A0A4S5BXB8_9BURK|nr:aminoacyl-tRNA hydrolase [Lampropedia aestuarii]MDH5858770.1 aminoacyl-tRNA hydrolase [Lampropedia aestuarii]THJ34606.1 aminoacyl-tRNA hydrolase [Lampropedia aestuarii]
MALKLLVGLGNPGPEYEATRHNAGFWWIDAVARSSGVFLQPEKGFFGNVAKARIADQAVWLVEPMTFMNRSGQSVAALARFYRIEPQEILVVHDELDLLPGQVKLKKGGSHAGHNGLKDIQAQLGSADFWRLRIGVGHPGVKSEVINWVLKKPSREDIEAIEVASERAMSALHELVQGDMELAMRKIHNTAAGVKGPKVDKPSQS